MSRLRPARLASGLVLMVAAGRLRGLSGHACALSDPTPPSREEERLLRGIELEQPSIDLQPQCTKLRQSLECIALVIPPLGVAHLPRDGFDLDAHVAPLAHGNLW